MRKIFVSIVAGALLAGGGLATTTAEATNGVTAKYGCNTATFTNHTKGTVGINYGTASSGDATGVQVKAGKSVTVKSHNKSFGWTATNAKGKDVGHEWDGVNLKAKCKSEPTKKATKKATVAKKTTTKKGLAKTGV